VQLLEQEVLGELAVVVVVTNIPLSFTTCSIVVDRTLY
jgi:hypothetical protein